MKNDTVCIKKKSLEAILLKIFRGEYWLWPSLVKTDLGKIEKVKVHAGQIFLYDEDPEDVLVCFTDPPSVEPRISAVMNPILGSECGGFEIEEE